MKLVTDKIFLLILITFTLALTATPLMAQVYKIVDADGNVTYTDKPPREGAEPIKLAPISVIEAPVYEKASGGSAQGEDDEMSLRDMRRNYRDFAIIAPQQEESIWHPEEAVIIAWSTGIQLQEGMKVTIFLNGRQQATTTERVVPVSGLERGEYTVTAELKDARNRRVVSAQAVTFFIRRPGLTARPRVSPRGGG